MDSYTFDNNNTNGESDEELWWKENKAFYDEFEIYCTLKRKKSNGVVEAPQASVEQICFVIKQAHDLGDKMVYREAVKYAEEHYKDRVEYKHAQAWVADAEGKYKKALSIMQSTEGGDDAVFTWMIKLKMELKKGHIEYAFHIGSELFKVYNDGCDNDKDVVSMAVRLAHIFNESDDKEAVYYFIKEALFIDPDNIDALLLLAYWECDMKVYHLARQSLNRLLDVDPYFLPAWHKLGSVLSALGEHKEAEKAYEYCISIDPNFLPPLSYLGFSNLLDNNFSGAIEHFQELIDKSERNKQFEELAALVAPQLAICYLKIGDKNKATEMALKGLKSNHIYMSLLVMLYIRYAGMAQRDTIIPTKRNLVSYIKRLGLYQADHNIRNACDIMEKGKKGEFTVDDLVAIAQNPLGPDIDFDNDDEEDIF